MAGGPLLIFRGVRGRRVRRLVSYFAYGPQALSTVVSCGLLGGSVVRCRGVAVSAVRGHLPLSRLMFDAEFCE